MPPQDTITCFGLGLMGSALVHSFVQSGLKVTIWNRTPGRETVKTLVDAGAKFEKDPTTAVNSSFLILLCLLDYESVYQVLDQIDPTAFKNKTVVNLTTANSKDGPEMSEWMHARGVKGYFDGAIMNIPQHVGQEHAFTYVCGGSEQAFREIEPALKSTGAWEYLGANLSAAAIHDCSLLAGLYGMFGGCLTAIALLSKSKPPRPTAKVVKTQLIPALRGLLEWVEEAAEKFDEKDWAGYTATNEVNAHALVNINKTCEAEGIDISCLTGVTKLFDQSVKDGKGAGGMAYCVNYLLDKRGAN